LVADDGLMSVVGVYIGFSDKDQILMENLYILMVVQQKKTEISE